MKIRNYDFYFVLGPFPIKYPSGGIKIIYALARQLRRRNYQVAIHFLTDHFRAARKAFPDKIVREWPLHAELTKNILNNKLSFNFIVPIIRKAIGVDFKDDFEGIDLFFARSLPKNVLSTRYFATDYATAFFVEMRTPHAWKYFISLHDESDQAYLSNLSWLAAESYKLPLKLMVINSDMRSRYIQNSPLLFHVGIADFFRNGCVEELKRKRTSVLMPLRTGKMKGAIYGIEAAKLIHKNLSEVEIVAFGNYPKESVPDFIQYYYMPNDATILDLYRKATIFILPSLFEGFSLPPLEAMANGCAGVSSDCVGIREYMVDGVNGVLVPKGDPKSLYEGVSRLLKDETMLRTLMNNGRKTAEKYSYENMTEEFLSVIEKYEKTVI